MHPQPPSLAAGRAHPSGCALRAAARVPGSLSLPCPLAHAPRSSYLPVALLTARTAVSMIRSSRLLWAPRQYTWPQLWQRENAW